MNRTLIYDYCFARVRTLLRVCAYQVVVLEDHVVGLGLPTQAQQADDVGVAELRKHFGLAAEVQLELLVSGLQALHQHHRLLLALLDTLGFAQQHLTKLPLACAHNHKESMSEHISFCFVELPKKLQRRDEVSNNSEHKDVHHPLMFAKQDCLNQSTQSGDGL